MPKDLLDLSFLDNGEGSEKQPAPQQEQDTQLLDVSFLDSPEQSVQEEDWGTVLNKTIGNLPDRFALGVNAIIQDIRDRFSDSVTNISEAQTLTDRLKRNPNDEEARAVVTNLGVNPDEIAASTSMFDAANQQLSEAIRLEKLNKDPEVIKLVEEAADLQETLKQNAPVTEQWSAKGIISNILGSLAEMAPGVIAAVATKKPSVGSAFIASNVYGQSLAEGKEMGLDAGQSRNRAYVMALAEFFPETMALGQLFKRGGTFAGDLARTGLSESAQEMVTQTINEAYDAGIVGEETTLGEAINNIAYSGVVGFGAGTTMGVATAPIRSEPADKLDREVSRSVSDRAASPDVDALDEMVAQGDALDAQVEQRAQENQIPDYLKEVAQPDYETPAYLRQAAPERRTADITDELGVDIPKEISPTAEELIFEPQEVEPVEGEVPVLESVGETIRDADIAMSELDAEIEAARALFPEEEAEPEPTVKERREAMEQKLYEQRVEGGIGEIQQRLSRPAAPSAEALIKKAPKEAGPTPEELEFRRQQNEEFLQERKTAKVPESLREHEHGNKLMTKGYRDALRGYRGLSQKVSRATKLDPSVDSISEAAAKAGGLSRSQASKEGFDEAAFNRNKAFPAKGGKTFDEIAETLNQYGYRNREGGPLTANDVVDLVSSEVNNQETHYSSQVDPDMITEDSAAVREWSRELGGNDKLNNAITKALRGEKLGTKQSQVIGEILDTVNAIRSENVPAAIETLQAKREERRSKEADSFNELVREVSPEYESDFDTYSEVMSELPEEADEFDAALVTIAEQAYDINEEATDAIAERFDNGEIDSDQAIDEFSSIINQAQAIEDVEPETEVKEEAPEPTVEDKKPETVEEVIKDEPIEEEVETERPEDPEPVSEEPAEEAEPEEVTEEATEEATDSAEIKKAKAFEITFGKWKGKNLGAVMDKTPGYIDWIESKAEGAKGFNRTRPELMEAIKLLKGEVYEPDTIGDLEQDRAESIDTLDQGISETDRRKRSGEIDQQVTENLEEGRSELPESSGVPIDSPLDVGAQEPDQVAELDAQPVSEIGTSGSVDSRGSANNGDERLQPESDAAQKVFEEAKRRSQEQRESKQLEADKVKVETNNAQNISDTLPLLTTEQISDVVKAESRLYGDGEKGILFTNGTGTGKTYTGTGVAKRAVQSGKKVLAVVPNGTIPGWQSAAKAMNFEYVKVKNKATGSAGNQASITTYQNFADNPELMQEHFDLVIYDESHKLMANMQGDSTKATSAHFAITNKEGRSRGQHALRKEFSELAKDIKAESKKSQKSEAEVTQLPRFKRRRNALIKQANEIDKKAKKAEKDSPTKAVFLSATPFSGHKTVFYGDGYLFNTDDGYKQQGGYNSGNPEQQFLVKNFGYRMKYNKANQPGPEVDIGLLERDWADQMFDSGAMIGRVLDLPRDYSREFVVVEKGVGKKVDDLFETVNYKDYPELSQMLQQWRKNGMDRQLAEALRVRGSLERIKSHLDMGRKVVVFHQRMNIDIADPFAGPLTEKQRGEFNKFKKAHPKLAGLDFSDLSAAPSQIVEEFGRDRVSLFNGENTKERNNELKAFNDDSGSKDIIVISKDAGKEGLSAHDISGKFPRALIVTNTPQSPADAIQMEGRIYRFGLETNAVIEYPSVQTNFEKIAFRDTVSRRTATAENLAMGSQARLLRESFREGYMEPRTEMPGVDQGIGGKESDRNTAQVTEYDRAKTYYYKRAKRTQATKAAEGADYFATPEPIGLKMVELARLLPGERAMEPSAGHGAISRWLPDSTTNLMIEQSPQLIGELSLTSEGDVKNMDFEDLNLVNKFDAIVMNPPFGRGGSQAIKHIDKAFKHLSDGGRIVAIYPEGPAADKKFDAWYEETSGVYMTGEINLPAVTFARAGTGVRTRILVLDKDMKGGNATDGLFSLDLGGLDEIGRVFDSMEQAESLPRPDVSISGREVGLNTEEKYGKFIAELTEFQTSGKARSLGKRELKKLAEKYFGEVESTRDYWDKTTYTFDNQQDRNKFFKAIVEEATPKGKALASIVKEKPKGLPGKDVQNEVDKFLKEYAGVAPVDVSIVEKSEDAPIDMPPGRAVRAVYNPSSMSMVIVSENLNSAEEVQQVLRHELIVHYGLRSLMGKERYNMHMDRLLRSKDKRLMSVMDEVRDTYDGYIDLDSKEGQRILAEEALAKISEGDLTVGPIRRFVNAILRALKKIKFIPDTATYTDAVNLINSNAEGLRKRVIGKGDVVTDPVEATYDENPYLASLYNESTINDAPVSDDIKDSIKSVHFTGDNRSFVQRVKDALTVDMRAARQGIIDQFESIKTYEIEKFGALMSAEESAYKMSAMSTDTNAIVETALKYGVPKYDNGTVSMRDGVKPLQDVIGQVTDLDPDLLPVWTHWLAAKRVKDQRLIEQGKEQLFTQEMVDEIFGYVNENPEMKRVFEQAQKDYAKFNKATLDFAEDAGLINRESREMWENDSYVPFYRITEEAQRSGPFGKRGIEGQSAGIKALRGGTDKLNILESMVQNPMHLIGASYKNLAMQKVVELTDGIAMDKVPLKWQPVSVSNTEIAKALRDIGIDFDRLTIEQREQYSTLFRMNAPQGENIVSVMNDGKREYYEVNDPLLLNSVTALGPQPVNEILRFMGIPKRLLTNMVTSTPPFMVRNFIRDTVANYVQADKSTGTTAKDSITDAALLKPFRRGMSGMAASIKEDKDRWTIMAAGGMSGEYFGSSTEDVTKDIVKPTKSGVARAVSSLFNGYRHVVRGSEEATRIAVYRQVKENGGSDFEAAYQAKNVLNFSRHGQYKVVQFLIQTVPFFNARLQGLERLYQGAKASPASFAMRGALLTAATFALMAMNDDREEYWALPEWERDTYWHAWVGDVHIRIPKPFEVGAVFATVPERMYEAATRDEKVFLSRMGNMFIETFAMNPIPQVFSPIVEQVSNRSFFMDRPIVSMSLENLSPELQFTNRTSQIAKYIAQLMPDFMPEWTRSPVRVEHLVNSYFGTVGGYVLMSGDYMAKKMTDAPIMPAKRVTEYPLISDFIRTGERSSKYVGRFYDMAEQANKINSSIKDLIRQERMDEAREQRTEYGSILQIRRKLNRARKRMSDLNTKIKRIYINKNLSAEEKRRKIELFTRKKNDIAKDISEQYWKLF